MKEITTDFSSEIATLFKNCVDTDTETMQKVYDLIRKRKVNHYRKIDKCQLFLSNGNHLYLLRIINGSAGNYLMALRTNCIAATIGKEKIFYIGKYHEIKYKLVLQENKIYYDFYLL